MPSERGATRQVPLATPFGRLVHDRGESRGVALSAAVHLALVAALLWGGARFLADGRAPGPGHGRGGGGGGGGGGNRTLVLYVPPAPAPPPPAPPPTQVAVPTVPVPVPAPVVKPADSTPKPAAPPVRAAVAGPGAGAGTGSGKGPGTGTGSGGGTGSGAGPGVGADSGGGGGSIYPPQPQTIIMPPSDRPSSVRGTTVTAVFQIAASGEVVRVALHPMPRDRKFAAALLEKLRAYSFTPAYTLDGHPIAAAYTISFEL